MIGVLLLLVFGAILIGLGIGFLDEFYCSYYSENKDGVIGWGLIVVGMGMIVLMVHLLFGENRKYELSPQYKKEQLLKQINEKNNNKRIYEEIKILEDSLKKLN